MLASRLDTATTGKYCELLVILAFVGDGKEVALPFGNQKAWDLLVLENDKWSTVQVRCVNKVKREGRVITRGTLLRKCQGKNMVKYEAGELDYYVFVMPEYGTMWKLPFSESRGRAHVNLKHREPWIRGSLPETFNHIPSRVVKGMKCEVPKDRPEGVAELDWRILQMRVNRVPYAKMRETLGLDNNAIAYRLRKVADQLEGEIA